MRQPLDSVTRSWVQGHEAAMRKAAADAIAASNRWRQLNAALMEKLTAERRSDYEIAQVKAANLALTDAYSTYSFFAGKAQMHAAVLQGALAARQLLADDDPTGLLYSRDDEPPATSVPSGRDGWAITGRNQRPTNSPAGSAFDTVERRTPQVTGRPGAKQGEAGTRGPASPSARAGAR